MHFLDRVSMFSYLFSLFSWVLKNFFLQFIAISFLVIKFFLIFVIRKSAKLYDEMSIVKKFELFEKVVWMIFSKIDCWLVYCFVICEW